MERKQIPLVFHENRAFRRKNAMRQFGLTPLLSLPLAGHFDPLFELNKSSKPTYVMSREEEAQRFLEFNYAKKCFNLALKIKSRTRHKWYRRQRHLQEYLCRLNMPLVYSYVSRNFARLSLDYEDAISEGQEALLRAIPGFDIARGVKFSSYAVHIIVHSLVACSIKQYRKRSKISTVELPDEMGEGLPDPREEDDGNEAVAALNEALATNTAGLTDCEKTIIQHRYGLGDTTRLTLDELGKIVGLTKERVRQIQIRALGKLRAVLTK